VVYNLWFHPLGKYPGPKLAAITPLWFGHKLMRGTAPVEVLKQHERYGPVLRIGPNELTFVEPAAWKDIYGHRKVGEPELQKDKKYHAGFAAQPTLVNADRAQHSVLRKALSHGFSEASLRLQEPILRKFQDTLVNQLAEKGQHGKVALDMVSWYSVSYEGIPNKKHLI
jgi:cytochrome P450